MPITQKVHYILIVNASASGGTDNFEDQSNIGSLSSLKFRAPGFVNDQSYLSMEASHNSDRLVENMQGTDRQYGPLPHNLVESDRTAGSLQHSGD